MTDSTLLVLTGIGVTPYSARGLTQTLEVIQQAAQLRRTVDGTLVSVSQPQFQKYRSTISCTDQEAPALDGVWPGLLVTVDCVAELAYPAGSSAGPSRDAVPGSTRTEGDFDFYRPRLDMMVVGFTEQTDEYGASVGWTLELEEV